MMGNVGKEYNTKILVRIISKLDDHAVPGALRLKLNGENHLK